MTTAQQNQTFTIRRDLLYKAPLLLIGVVESNSRVQIGESTIDIQYGMYSTTISIDIIESVEAIPWPIYRGIGIRLNFQKSIGLVGSTEGVVRINLREPAVSFLGVKCSSVSISFEEPELFLAAVQAAIAT